MNATLKTKATRNSTLAAISLDAARSANGRIRNWTASEPIASIVVKGDYDETNHGRYSRSCKYNRYSYTPRYTSFFTEENGTIVYQYGFAGEIKTVRKPVPAGTKFEIDSLGVKLVRVSDGLDYHFTGDYFLNKKFVLHARMEFAKKYKFGIEQNKKNRAAKKNAAQQIRFDKLFNRDLKNTYVNLNDSLSVQNCLEGTLRFAELRLKINREDILRGGHLCMVNAAKLVQTKDERAIRAAKAAWARETTVCI